MKTTTSNSAIVSQLICLCVGIILGAITVFLFYSESKLDHKAFSDIARGIQSIVFSIGLLFGGLWTILTFHSFGTLKKEKAELERIQRELREQAIVGVNIDANILNVSTDLGFTIELVATVENVGNRLASFEFKESPFLISKLIETKVGTFDIEYTFEIPIIDAKIDTEGADLSPKEKTKFCCVHRIKEPGVYLAQFSVNIHGTELQTLAELGGTIAERHMWSASKIICLDNK